MDAEWQREGRQWNLFARELDDILAAHGYRLGHLNDRAEIHPEKVRRLQHSLSRPRFHMLAPDEIERVCDVFGFSHDERLRLKAAILATGIEVLLMNRINQDDALSAAEQMLPALRRAVQAHDGDEGGLGAVKAIEVRQTRAPDALEDSLETLDLAALAWVLAGMTGDVAERTAGERAAAANAGVAAATIEQAARLGATSADGADATTWTALARDLAAKIEREASNSPSASGQIPH